MAGVGPLEGIAVINVVATFICSRNGGSATHGAGKGGNAKIAPGPTSG